MVHIWSRYQKLEGMNPSNSTKWMGGVGDIVREGQVWSVLIQWSLQSQFTHKPINLISYQGIVNLK